MSEAPGYILVVDDNRINRMTLARTLEREGHCVAMAEDGQQALEMIEAELFDLVLLDIVMPEVDGYEVLARLRESGRLRDLPVIVISSVEEMERIVRCIEMGAEDYLPKPFDPVLLRARINAGLTHKRMRDKEVEYLRHVALLTAAAAAVESRHQDADDLGLEVVAARSDALGKLACVFQGMARVVYAREQQLKEQVQTLQIELDAALRARQVSEITESEYFQTLQAQVKALRKGPRSDA
jgi:two-component system, cell cycle response regulator